MNRMWEWSLVTLLLVVSPAIANGEESSRLQELRERIEKVEATVKEVRAKIKIAEEEARTLDASIRSISGKLSSKQKEFSKVKESRVQAEVMVRETEDKIRDIEQASLRRIRAIYMAAGHGGVLTVRNRGDWGRAALYIAKVRTHDVRLMEDLRLLRTKRDTETGKLNHLQRQQTEILASLELQRRELESRRKRQGETTRLVQGQRKELERNLLELKAQSLRMETVLHELTGGEVKRPEVSRVESSSGAATLSPFEGKGLGRDLPRPFEGKLKAKFGSPREPGVKGMNRKGLEVSGSGPVKAVARGRVAHVGTMPQLGSVVVVDHGEREYSLYGRLGTTVVERSQVVEVGQRLGEVTEGVFYFEVRRRGKAEDPNGLLNSKFK